MGVYKQIDLERKELCEVCDSKSDCRNCVMVITINNKTIKLDGVTGRIKEVKEN